MTGEEDEVRNPFREAASEGGDLRERVRELVLAAIVKREADPKAFRDVMRAAVTGLGEGLRGHAELAGGSVESALAGLDEAVSKSLYALQMAVEEAWDKGSRFAEADLRDAYEAVRDLDDDMVGTLRDVGGMAEDVLQEEFARVSEHLSRNGSDTGERIKSVMTALGRDLDASTEGLGQNIRTDARQAAGRLSAVTSGILRGLADALDARTR